MEDDDIQFAVLRELEDNIKEWGPIITDLEGLGGNWAIMARWLLQSSNETIVMRTQHAIAQIGKEKPFKE